MPLPQELERGLTNAKARCEEALAAQVKAQGALTTLEHRHAEMEVRLAQSGAIRPYLFAADLKPKSAHCT